ncbi:MAG: hypothetical protein Q8L00_04985, partial [Deltaproteobacteria bacterium]|nr:hypothetical protein [Deltaproteobacteria bacterium]
LFNKDWIVFSNYYGIVQENMVESMVHKYDCFIGSYIDKCHYSDIGNYYHLSAGFRLVKLLNSSDIFLGMMLRHIMKKINPREIDIVLFSAKPTNILFSNIFGAKEFGENTLFHKVSYDEFKIGNNIKREVKYTDGESLKGKRIMIIEALHIFPGPMIEIIKEVQKQEGIIKKIVILFNGFLSEPSFSPWVKDNDLLVAWDINLICLTTSRCCNNPAEILPYNNYWEGES